MQKSNLKGLEPAVKNFQETGDDRYFDIILTAYRGAIQGRVYNAVGQYGLDDVDCESTLTYSLWKAAETYDPDRGVPFDAYVALKFGQDLRSFFTMEKRYNKFCGPTAKQEEEGNTSSIKMVYYLADDNWEWDMADTDPRADVENFIVDEDAAASLLESIRGEAGEAEANVAALIACGYNVRIQ